MTFQSEHWTKLTEEELAEWQALAPNFSPKEIASKGDGSIVVIKEALKALQRMRDIADRPLTINSGYRDPAYNRAVGGVLNSQHTRGRAFDIHIANSEEGRELERIAEDVGFTAIGRYPTFIHVDMRPPKSNGGGYRWGSWK
tara:strand:+ start:6470 stop:6895 length:426 start_codon:yes stop_codon:yes gene_type:complete